MSYVMDQRELPNYVKKEVAKWPKKVQVEWLVKSMRYGMQFGGASEIYDHLLRAFHEVKRKLENSKEKKKKAAPV